MSNDVTTTDMQQASMIAEIDATDETRYGMKVGLAVKWAVENSADLTDAVQRPFKHDLWGVLLQNQAEIPFLLRALCDGKVNGSIYSGSCACLMGTIANAKKCAVDDLVCDAGSAAECWFMQISEGKTPENSGVVKMTVEWIEEFLRLLNGVDQEKAA